MKYLSLNRTVSVPSDVKRIGNRTFQRRDDDSIATSSRRTDSRGETPTDPSVLDDIAFHFWHRVTAAHYSHNQIPVNRMSTSRYALQMRPAAGLVTQGRTGRTKRLAKEPGQNRFYRAWPRNHRPENVLRGAYSVLLCARGPRAINVLRSRKVSTRSLW